MSICKYTDGDLKELDQIIKWEPRSKNTLGKQSSDERLYMIRENIRKGIELVRNIYKETKLKVTCFMVCLKKWWIKAAWRIENAKEENYIVEEAIKPMEDIEVEIQFEEGIIQIDGELIEKGWKPAWKKLKEKLKKGKKKQRIDEYERKLQQSILYRDKEQEFHAQWPYNLTLVKQQQS